VDRGDHGGMEFGGKMGACSFRLGLGLVLGLGVRVGITVGFVWLASETSCPSDNAGRACNNTLQSLQLSVTSRSDDIKL